MTPDELKQKFYECYGFPGKEPQLYFAPGRVNLIGEHTDYNGGFVLPCAIQYGTWLAMRETPDGLISLASANDPVKICIAAENQLLMQEVRWFNYPLGVMDQFVKQGKKLSGMELYFYGDIPSGAGLSSSASIEMVTAFALNDILQAGIDPVELTKMGQRAEQDFARVNCGIMDQFAVGLGDKNHALFLNCHTLEYKLIPVLLPGYKFIIANTNKKRGLADSKYNERVEECATAVKALQPFFDITRLGEISFMEFYKVQERIEDEVIRRRARHVISENQRVLNAVSCLLKSDLLQFGALMTSSHESLRDNYEVTGIELDTMVEEALKIDGVLGSRMTGAGFGGCTVTLIKDSSIERFIGMVGKNYHEKTGLTADFYVVEVSDGMKRL